MAIDTVAEDLTSSHGIPFFPAGQGPDDAARAIGQAAAAQHVIERGLAYPLKSSIVRGFLQTGEVFAEAIVILPVFYTFGKGLIAEGEANKAGTCSTAFGSN